MILDGVLRKAIRCRLYAMLRRSTGSIRLTVLKAYQQLVDEELVEMKRGLGMFVKAGRARSVAQGRTPEISH